MKKAVEINTQETITINWINTHNLKNIDIQIPKNKLITISWVSWSGKSSLAFDTIYKEWQFRYIESLSSYLRQFFNLWDRPDILSCSWLSPAISIEQNKKWWNSRSSVWTLTEIDDYIRLLFAKLGTPYCYNCNQEIKPETVDEIISTIKTEFNEKKIFILRESWLLKSPEDTKKFIKKNRNKVEKWEWFTRYLVLPKFSGSLDWTQLDNEEKLDPIEFFYLEEPNIPESFFPAKVFGIYDRITIEEQKIDRLKEDVIKILNETNKFWIYSESWDELKIKRFTDKMYCPNCNIEYPDFTTQHFSPNRQEWACETCHWIWEVLQADLEKIIDPFSPYHKAILPRRDSNFWQAILSKLAEKYSMDVDKIRQDQPERFQHVLIHWDQEVIRINTGWKYSSIKYQWIENIIKEQYLKWLLTVDFQAMINMQKCPTCNWAKLKRESLNVFLHLDKEKHTRTNISDLQILELTKLQNTLEDYIKVSDKNNILVSRITKPLIDRVKTITELWLGYINLSRQTNTLSGWEIQRLRLTKQLWNKLTWILYVLDEPTIWLDTKEIKKVITAIKKLKDMWNTIIVVEHHEEMIKSSDWIVEIWPWAWDFGWELIFNGPYKDFLKSNTLTAQYITWEKQINVEFTHSKHEEKIKIKKASKHNLKNIDIDFNLWSFTVITWPSWAWKTTLMYDTLYKFLTDKEKFIQSYIRLQLLKKWMSREEIISAPVMQKQIYEHYKSLAIQEFYQEIWVETIIWHEYLKNTIYVDQASIGKTPRSCPATFIWTFDKIRKIYAWTSTAKYMWFKDWQFSFNSKKWACTACNWYWYKKIELQFLPDTYIPCELCKWKRYKSEVLEIKWNGKNISEVLDMYIYEALDFFKEISHIQEELELMNKIGLWYIKLWQPAHTLSGWESQRLKLIKHLLKSYKWHTVYFLDEPTVWLHPKDIEKLLLVLKEFLDNGDTILMIEHDEDILRFADDIIRLDKWKVTK